MKSEERPTSEAAGTNETIGRKYAALHRQGWVPIFVNDKLDAVRLAEVCAQRGCRAIELTCRRARVMDEIRDIRRNFPDLLILVGSVVDRSVLLPYLQSRRTDFPDMEQLADLGADGFVSQLPMSERTIRQYAGRSLLIPGVETLCEAVAALDAGAHFVKFVSCPPSRVKQINSDATHRLFPVFYTGGAHAEIVPEYIRAGAALIGGGWDIILGGKYEAMQDDFDAKTAGEALERFLRAVQRARAEIAPYRDHPAAIDEEGYLQSLSHYHPFRTA